MTFVLLLIIKTIIGIWIVQINCKHKVVLLYLEVDIYKIVEYSSAFSCSGRTVIIFSVFLGDWLLESSKKVNFGGYSSLFVISINRCDSDFGSTELHVDNGSTF